MLEFNSGHPGGCFGSVFTSHSVYGHSQDSLSLSLSVSLSLLLFLYSNSDLRASYGRLIWSACSKLQKHIVPSSKSNIFPHR